MKQTNLPIFYETLGALPPGGFLSDDAYKEARVCLPFIGTDAYIADLKAKILFLPYRRSTPAQGLWGIGGGWKTGKTPIEAMIKAFERETSLVIDADRFIERADLMNVVMWSTEPIVNLHMPYFIELSREERDHVAKSLDPKEYDQSKGLTQIDSMEMLDKKHKEGEVSDGAIDALRLYYSIFS